MSYEPSATAMVAWDGSPGKGNSLSKSVSAVELRREALAEAYPATLAVPRQQRAKSSGKKNRTKLSDSGFLPGLNAIPSPVLSKYHPEELDELRALRLRNSELEITIKRAVGMPRDAPRWQSIYWKEAEKLVEHAILRYCGPAGEMLNGSGGPVEPRRLSAGELQRACTWFMGDIVATDHKLKKANEKIEELRYPGTPAASETAQVATRVAQKSSSSGPPSSEPSLAASLEMETKLKEAQMAHAAELKKLRERLQAEHQRNLEQELKERLSNAEMEMDRTLSKQKLELSGAASEKVQELEKRAADLEREKEAQRKQAEAKAKEERIELFRRQIVRRIMNREITLGWTAWKERWEAKTYAMNRLRECGNKLREPGLASKFILWSEVALELRREKEYANSLKANAGLEGQLRYANYQLNQLNIVKAAQDDELKGLQQKASALGNSVKDTREQLAAAVAYKRELAELKELYKDTKEDLDEAEKRIDIVKAELAEQREGSENLVKKLLREQRLVFDTEVADLTRQLDVKTAAQEKEARIEVLRKVAMRRMLFAAINRGWEAWRELTEARHEAMNALRTLGSKVGAKNLGAAFTLWTRNWQDEKHYMLHASKEQQQARHHKEVSQLEKAVDELRVDLETTTSQKQTVIEKMLELQQQVVDLGGETEGVKTLLAEQAEVEKTRRVETFGRQVIRRIMHDGLRKGFTSWNEMWKSMRHAKDTLSRTAQRFRAAIVKSFFAAWIVEWEAQLYGNEMQLLAQERQQLEQRLKALEEKTTNERSMLKSKLSNFQEEKAKALHEQMVQLTGTQEEKEAMMAERAKEERIEMMHRQAGRRLLHAGLSAGWEAWVERWQAKTYALRRLRQVANRLRKPNLTWAMGMWNELLEEKRQAEAEAQLSGLQKKELELERRQAQLEAELDRVREDCELKLAKAEEAKDIALQRQLVELTGTAEEIAAIREAEEKEGRVELLGRQVGRRFKHRDLSLGFIAWVELWDAKKYAMDRLRQCGNKFRKPGLTDAFNTWVAIAEEEKRVAAWRELEAQSKSLEAQLRRAKLDTKQTNMVKVAQDDEIKALKIQVDELQEGLSGTLKKLAAFDGLPEENVRLRQVSEQAVEEAKEAVQKREEAEADVLKQLDANKELLEKLLEEQRVQLTKSDSDTKKKLSAESKQAQAFEAELNKLKEEVERKNKVHTTEVNKLREEVKRLTAPPPKKEKPKPSKGIGSLDLDEGPDAPPVSEQLAVALKQNATRVVDLFRSWDSDGDGQVSRAEFHKAMPELGLDVPKRFIDDLFSEWDKDGGGEIGYKELVKILKAPKPPSPPPKVKVPKSPHVT